MRSLKEIVAAVQAGESPEYDELFYAVSAQQHLLRCDGLDLVTLTTKGAAGADALLQDHVSRLTGAEATPPQLWLTDYFDPRNPEFQERRLEEEAAKRKILH